MLTLSSHLFFDIDVHIDIKKIFPTLVVLLYMYVKMSHGVYARGYGLVGWLRISNPGWKNYIFNI